MAKATGATKRKVPIHNPFPKGGGKTAVLRGAKRSITDLYKGSPIRNPIKGGVSNSAVKALSEQSYKAGLLAGKAKGGKANKNPIGMDEAIDLLKVGALGAGMAFGIDLLAGQVFPKLRIYKKDTQVTDSETKIVTTEKGNENVYWLAKLAATVVAAEVLAEPTKGASYTGGGAAVATFLHGWAVDKFNGREGASGSSLKLGALPQMRVVAPPALPPMQPMTFAGASRPRQVARRGIAM